MNTPPQPATDQALRAENFELRARLEEAEDMLRAIRGGGVDALVVEGDAGPQLFTLQGHDAEQNRVRGEMLAQVSDAVIAVDTEERVTFFNAAAERQYGVRARDALGRQRSEVFAQSWQSPDAEAAMRTALRGRGEWRGELIQTTHDGRELHVECVVSAVRGPDGAGTGYVAAIRDVSERKQAEEALREKGHFLQRVTTITPSVVYIMDLADLRITWVNTQVATVMGYSVEEVLELGPAFMPRAMHPDDLLRMPAHFEQLARSRDGELVEIEYRLRHPDGTWRWFGGRTTPFSRDAKGNVREIIGTSSDITERKRADEAIARLAAIVESSHDALFGEDLDGIVTSWNRGAEEVFGYRAEAIIGTSILRLIPEDRQAEEHETQRKLAAGERGGTFETIRRAKDGREFPVSITVSPLKDAAGQVIGTSRAVRDITERNRVEAALRESEARFRAAVGAVSGLIWTNNARGEMEGEQPGWGGFTGQSQEEYQGYGWARAVHPEDAQPTIDAWNQAVAEKRTFNAEHRVRRNDGEWRLCAVRAVPLLGEAGDIREWVGVHTDITERRQTEMALRASEVRMRLATEATEVGIWEWNVLTNTIRWDAQMFQLYGVAPTADGLVSYETWRRAVLPEELARQEEVLQDTVRRRGKSTREFHILRADDGERRWIQSVETVRANEEGEAEWVIGTNRDLTERKRAEDALRDNAAVLADVDRRKDAFLAALAHELRNPLGVIGSSLQLLRLTGQDREAVQQGCVRMERQVVVLTRLIDDLMDVSRINEDKLTLRTERLDLATVAQSALETSRGVIDQRGHTVTVVRPPQPIVVDGDAIRLTQVVSNLLSNAAKYSAPGRPIVLTVERQGDVAAVAVRDAGIGIAPADLRRIFDLFEQVGSAAHLARGGLGIGLHLVQRVVELHGGSVEARSDGLGQGSEFLVRLPLAASGARLERPADGDVLSPPPSRRYRILVADDNEDAVTALALLLRHLGHDVRTAANGAQAVAIATTFRPEVAVLDIGMPELDGHEACRRIREQPGGDTMLLVALSGWGRDEDKRRAQDAGFQHHLVKPLDPAALTELLHALARS